MKSSSKMQLDFTCQIWQMDKVYILVYCQIYLHSSHFPNVCISNPITSTSRIKVFVKIYPLMHNSSHHTKLQTLLERSRRKHLLVILHVKPTTHPRNVCQTTVQHVQETLLMHACVPEMMFSCIWTENMITLSEAKQCRQFTESIISLQGYNIPLRQPKNDDLKIFLLTWCLTFQCRLY